MPDSKSIFLSKTFWANVLAPIFLFLATKYGFAADTDTQMAVITIVMALANLLLRLVTSSPVHVVTPSSTVLRSLAFLLIIPLAVLSLGGCSVLQAITAGQSAQQAAPQTIAQAEKALTIAHLSYQGFGQLVLATTQQHLLKGPAAAQVKTIYDKAGDALLLADQADDAANVAGIADQVKAAEDLVASGSALINPPKH